MSDTRQVTSRAFDQIIGLHTLLSAVQPETLTPRQRKGLAGAEAIVMLAAHPGKLDGEDLATLAKAGLIFGAVLAGER